MEPTLRVPVLPFFRVDCRIGSLEIFYCPEWVWICVDCRIGSLEKQVELTAAKKEVDCRIGSLETHNAEYQPVAGR